MKFFIDSGNLKDIEALVPLGIIDGVTTNPSLMAKEGGDPRAIIKEICRLVQGPVSAEVVATDAAGMIARRPRAGRASTSTSSSRCRSRATGVEGVQGARRRGHARQRHADLLGDAGAVCRQGRRGVRQPVRRPARRHRVGRHGAHPADRRDLPATTTSRPRSSSPASAIRCTSSRPRGWAPTSARARPSVIEACFKHPLTDIGLEKFLKDWEKAQESQGREA